MKRRFGKLKQPFGKLKRRFGISVAFIAFAGVLIWSSVSYCQGDSVRRQSVGLVLSGGGARGVAHLGVIRALEEAQIPIDYVCGTSMGAIVGGLYASGYTVEEMERIFYSEEFQYWLTGRIEDEYVYIFNKKPTTPKAFSVSFDTQDKFAIQFPTGIMDPVQMDYAFMEIFAPANKACNGEFDSLMVPFFCVASDITDNKESIQREGNLGRSIRASMTFPFVFSPIEIDGKIMFDGGMYNNFPSREMLRTYRPDMIIGVKVAGNYPPPKEGNMKSYLENMLTTQSDYNVYCASSVLIEPNLSGIGVMEFDKMAECDHLGYEAARSQIETIREFLLDSVSREQMEEKRRAFNAKKPPLNVQEVSIQGVTNLQKYYISSIMHHSEQGLENNEIFNTEILKKNYISLYLDRNVKSIQPQLKFNDYFKSFILDLDVKTASDISLNLGGVLSTSTINYLYAAVEYNTLRKNAYTFGLNTYLGRFYSSLSLRTRVDFPTQHPVYVIGEANYNDWNFFRQKSGVFAYSPINYLEETEKNLRLSVGTPVFIKGQMFATVGLGESDDHYFDRDNGIFQFENPDRTKFKNFAAGIKYEHNTLDDVVFPTKGKYRTLSVQYVNGIEYFYPNGSKLITPLQTLTHDWVQIKMLSNMYFSLSDNYKIGLRGDVFFSFQDVYLSYKGSLLNAGVYSPTMETLTRYYPEYRANQYAAFGISNIYTMTNMLGINLSLKASAYIFAPLRQILTDNNIPYYGEAFRKYYFIASTSAVLRTPVGPLSLVFSYHQREDKELSPFSLSLTFGYTIFNNRNIER